ncbi:MAG: indole-3-glycerol phosphate synthase TrpC [Actinomycetota bacterium]|nr:indole-3-glycerol phosphate synthase TrpC [Actinomycetota bacterium]
MAFLDRVVESTRRRVEELKASVSAQVLEQRIASRPTPRGFRRSVSEGAPGIVAEIKRASPAKGDLNRDINASKVARLYAEGGASAISVLTEPEFFKGSMGDLESAQSAGLPVLRKDFILDLLQLMESRAAGADAVLLIARVVRRDLKALVEGSTALGMDPLVEVYDERDCELAAEAGATLIGINHRDLDSLEIDVDRTSRLVTLLPDGATVLALSGVATRSEFERLIEQGAHAVLVGESVVTAEDPVAHLRSLLGR